VTIYLTPEDDCSSNPAVTVTLNAKNTATVVPEKVVLHKDFLCHYSPFFNAAFNGTFKEGLTQEMTLQADTTAFGIVAGWFYSQKIEHLGPKSLVLLARVWILAQRFLLPKLQNMAMDEIYQKFYGVAADRTDFDLFGKIACSHGNGKNMLFEMGVDFLISFHEIPVNRWVSRLPHAMVCELVRRLKKTQDMRQIARHRASNYHVQEEVVSEK